MLQVYVFYSYGDNVGEAYFQLNTFLAELAAIDVQIPMEQVRANTKTYPDYGTTATTIEVFVDLSDSLAPHEMASQIEKLHAKVVHGETTAPGEGASTISEDELSLKEGHYLELHKDTDGWLLVDCHDDQRQVVFRDVQSGVLESLRHHLQRDPADDFDPFLDGDGDLP